jgi:hypothetical protein
LTWKGLAYTKEVGTQDDGCGSCTRSIILGGSYMDNPQQVRTFPKCRAPIHYTSLRPLILGMPQAPRLIPSTSQSHKFSNWLSTSWPHKFFNWRSSQTMRLGSYLIAPPLQVPPQRAQHNLSSTLRLRKNLSWKRKRFNNSSLTLKLMKKYHGKKKKGSIQAWHY